MVVTHGSTLVAFLVDTQENLDVAARVDPKIVPLIMPLPFRWKVLGQKLYRVLDLDNTILWLWVIREPYNMNNQ